MLEYLSLYTHRTASCVDGQMRFRWRDRKSDDALRTMTLPVMEFVRRFASHVLPTGFMRIRHYGLLANRGKTERLNRCRRLLGQRPRESQPVEKPTAIEWLAAITGLDTSTCPCCQLRLRVTSIPRTIIPARLPPPILDSS